MPNTPAVLSSRGETEPATNSPSAARPPRAELALSTVFLALLWFVLFRHLSGEWSTNEQYSYGWFVPCFAGYLFWLRWLDRPAPQARSAKQLSLGFVLVAVAVAALILLLPVRLCQIANPDWRALGWVHASAVVAVTLAFIWRSGGNGCLRHFAFPILFCLIAVPWMSIIEIPIIQGLMHGVAAVAAETLNLLGTPAQVEGSLIRVNTGLVGVNEACSGVRSLQTSLMIGLLFGELKRLSAARRTWLVIGALGVAFLANCLRAFFLVWIAATENPSAVDRWHDVAGYSIVGIVFVATIILTALLAPHQAEVAGRLEVAGTDAPVESRAELVPLPYLATALCWLLLVEISVEGWYRVHERNLLPEPSWSVRWPEATPGFRQIKIDENVRRTLHFDDGRQVRWIVRGRADKAPGSAPDAMFLGYFFRWNAGGSSVVRARAHRPDICLPQAGWQQVRDAGVKRYRVGAGIDLPFRHVSFRQEQGGASAQTFFCIQEDDRRPNEARPDLELSAGVQPDWGVRARLLAVRNGVRNLGQQVLEVIIVTPKPMEDAAAEARFRELLGEVIVPH